MEQQLLEQNFLKRLSMIDWVYALLLCVGAVYAFRTYGMHMDVYEEAILLLSGPCFAYLGWRWKPIRPLMLALAILSLFAVSQYAGQIGLADQKFFLKYFLSSQSAILWMSTFFFLSTLFYWGGLLAKSDFGASVGSGLCWAAVVIGATGMLVRWYESYLINPDVGHIPVSNLYEVFILFALITALFYLYYEDIYGTRQLGAFVLLIISAAIGFLLWYTVSRGAAEIQPLVPALQSWWMKIHVPANFIGYGTFSLAAMVAWTYLLRTETNRALWIGLVATPSGLLAFAWSIVVVFNSNDGVISGMLKVTKILAVLEFLFVLTIVKRDMLCERLPSSDLIEDMMYKAISVGFIFFTIATILGALWAAEAWGGYWSWDPKETWALIVWLNYAAWLHMRLMKGLRGQIAAWWALVGLLVTTFAFLGVNMFLSGLHSYGTL
ncbi:c-type cytochrome biogenesis protein CcsB [Undibacterium cyanobacteriorum]|uniref:C-type cytochrome biogenesis protein CcsB n=1 Tax=Undibacterium cyanobacteriorum TaxID=3073561 RepID=A0ABY9RLG9_9BURK|nr:c-type cytochrome biogenesis protein CcsB [Undibacterium sp. 20NA77.5]WMW81237.1 c-type cytochrome biogenesis protein CcsB [Undibacterium sp. 20NA77.5]